MFFIVGAQPDSKKAVVVGLEWRVSQRLKPEDLSAISNLNGIA